MDEAKLRELVAKWRITKESGTHEWRDGSMWAYGQCANELEAALASPPEPQPYAHYFKNAVCFTCEGESGQPPTRTVDICEQCYGDQP